MAMGRLDEAIARYRQAEDTAIPGSDEHKLALWGLGVALDRDEQVEKSRDAVARAIDKDPTMSKLSDDRVFFEPPGDKFYYLALGHEVAGERKEALAALSDYLVAQPRGRWARRARAHVDALKKAPPDPHPIGPIEVIVGDPFVLRAVRTPAQIATTLRERDGDVRLCYARALRAGIARPLLSGSVRITLEVTPEGRVLPDVQILETSVAYNDLAQCVREVAVNWRFPPVDGQDLETLVVPVYFGRRFDAQNPRPPKPDRP
jgi:hypothetical protein